MSKILAVILLAVMSVTMTKLEPVPNYGTIMTLQDFVESCLASGFTNNDGYGNYIDDGYMQGLVRPSDIIAGNIDISYTHIIWFNR